MAKLFCNKFLLYFRQKGIVQAVQELKNVWNEADVKSFYFRNFYNFYISLCIEPSMCEVLSEQLLIIVFKPM